MGLKLKPRVVQPWMRKLLRSGVDHILAQQGRCRSTIEEFRQYLEGQGRQGARFISLLDAEHHIYKTVHRTIMVVSLCQ